MAELFQSPPFGLAEPRSRIYLAIPVMGGFPAAVVDSLWRARGALAEAGYDTTLGILADHCHVDDSRNFLVRQFLASDCDALFFLDADVVAAPDAFVRLAGHDRDVVAGLYPYKDDSGAFPHNLAGGTLVQAEADGCIEIGNVPTGFLKIRRHVLETLEAKAKKFYGRNEAPDTHRAQAVIFERTFMNGLRHGGDYSFGLKWRAEGGKIHVDPTIPLGHIGSKTYHGDFGEFLCRQNGVDHPDFVRAARRLRGGDAAPEVFAALSNRYPNEWSASAELLATLWEIARHTEGDVLEAGSGLSTLVLGMAVAGTKRRIVSLEHDPLWRRQTQDLLDRYGVEGVALCNAPLRAVDGGFGYGLPIEAASDFGLLVVDGPPRQYGGRAAIYATAALHITSAVWIADDAVSEEPAFTAAAAAAGRTVQRYGDAKPFVVAMPPARAATSSAA